MKFSLKQFIAALIVAAWYSCRAQGGCASKAKGVISAILSNKSGVPQRIQDERGNICLECPVFNSKRQTCGAPDAPRSEDEPQLGCFCYMPMKIRTPCNCWLYDETKGEMGWARNLNSFPLHE